MISLLTYSFVKTLTQTPVKKPLPRANIMRWSVVAVAGVVSVLLAPTLFGSPALASQSSLVQHQLPSGQQVWSQKPAGITLIQKGTAHHSLALVNPDGLQPKFLRQVVHYPSNERAGTIIIDTGARFLYLTLPGNMAMRYGIGVARTGFEWRGSHKISRKAKWPGWTPPAEMRARQPELPRHIAGGPNNPLGARALYLGSTLYRIHGTNSPWTIGGTVSSGCIRLTNNDVSDLYQRVSLGAKVVVQ